MLLLDAAFFAQQEVKISSPDYRNIPSEEACDDFLARIKHYEDFYVPVDLDREK